MRTRPLYDVVALLARIGVGVVFMAHGWQKIEVGITATGRNFDDMGVPAPTASAIYATFAEILGGAALIVGLGLPAAGIALFADMAGAFVFVHVDKGVFLADGDRVTNGFELVLVLGLASLLFAAGAGGRLTLDNRLFARRTAAPGSGEPPPDPGSQRPEKTSAELEPGATPALGPTPALDPTGPTGERGSPGGPGSSGGSGSSGGRGSSGRRGSSMGRGSSGSAETAGTVETPAAPAAPKRAASPASPASETEPAPRLAAEIVEDTGRDVLVAGRRKFRRSKRSSTETTQPIERDDPGPTGDEKT